MNFFITDFGHARKWKYTNGTHKPRVLIGDFVGTDEYKSRAAIMQYSQGRRDDMESLMITFAAATTLYPIFAAVRADGQKAMWKERNDFITVPHTMVIKKPFANCRGFDIYKIA